MPRPSCVAPDGTPWWVSNVEPGSVHNLAGLVELLGRRRDLCVPADAA
ncbi:hypothetical protein [Streptomyces sp. NPDC056663]